MCSGDTSDNNRWPRKTRKQWESPQRRKGRREFNALKTWQARTYSRINIAIQCDKIAANIIYTIRSATTYPSTHPRFPHLLRLTYYFLIFPWIPRPLLLFAPTALRAHTLQQPAKLPGALQQAWRLAHQQFTLDRVQIPLMHRLQLGPALPCHK